MSDKGKGFPEPRRAVPKVAARPAARGDLYSASQRAVHSRRPPPTPRQPTPGPTLTWELPLQLNRSGLGQATTQRRAMRLPRSAWPRDWRCSCGWERGRAEARPSAVNTTGTRPRPRCSVLRKGTVDGASSPAPIINPGSGGNCSHLTVAVRPTSGGPSVWTSAGSA